MALESELLGAHALGVRNIIALTGDPPRVGDYPTGTGVWDVDSIGLIDILTRLNRGEDQSGSPIGQPAGYTIACALDPTAADAATEWDRLERKLAAGAHLVMTQPLYSVEQVETMFTEARRRFGQAGFPVPVLLGVLPLVSARHAEFLHNEVPGITIPDDARAAMHAAGERGSERGIEMADDLLRAVEAELAGTYIMPSFGRYEQCAGLVRRIRERYPRVVASARLPRAGSRHDRPDRRPAVQPDSTPRPPAGPAPRADRRPRRGDGHDAPGTGPRRGRLPWRALRRPPEGPAWRQRPPLADPAPDRPRDPRGLSRCRRRRDLDEFVHVDVHRPGRLRVRTGRRPRDERRRGAPRARGSRRGGTSGSGPPAIRGRVARARPTGPRRSARMSATPRHAA